MLANAIIRAHGLPQDVRAFSTTRHGGVSTGAFGSLNLGSHVGDEPASIEENRRRVVEFMCDESALRAPVWLSQVHGVSVLDLDEPSIDPKGLEADAAITASKGTVACVMTADCLPLVLTASRDSTTIALGAVHAGWKGLAAGVIEAAHTQLVKQVSQRSGEKDAEYRAWLGPAIGPEAFEVGPEVRDAMLTSSPDAGKDEHAFKAAANIANQKKYFADLYALATTRLLALRYGHISGGNFCTVRDSGTFFSHRRDAKLLGSTGRMATCAWITPT